MYYKIETYIAHGFTLTAVFAADDLEIFDISGFVTDDEDGEKRDLKSFFTSEQLDAEIKTMPQEWEDISEEEFMTFNSGVIQYAEPMTGGGYKAKAKHPQYWYEERRAELKKHL